MRIFVAAVACIQLLSDCRRTARPRHKVHSSDSVIGKENDTHELSVIDEREQKSDRYLERVIASLLFASNPSARHIHMRQQRAGVSDSIPRSDRLEMMQEEIKVGLSSDPLQYLTEERPTLLGKANSHQLVEADHGHDVLTLQGNVPDTEKRFLFVDEAACIGCVGCADIARSTFMMDEEFGKARVYQQLADDPDIIDESLDLCPVDCIHRVCFNELKALEKARTQGIQDGSHAATQLGSLTLRAEGRVPQWRALTAGEGSDPSIFDHLMDVSNDELERAKHTEEAIDALMGAEMFVDVSTEDASAVVAEEDDLAIRELFSYENVQFPTWDDP